MNTPLNRDRALRAGARGIAAGLPLDWRSLESSADGDAARNVIRQLRVLADIADVQRRLARGASADSSSSLWDTANANASPAAAHPRDGAYDGFATWGPLTLLERVGEGAFGEVYRAWDSRLDREVALKLLHARDSQGDIVGRVVIDEGRMLARVSHPNVVTVYGADRIDERVGLWMEFVRGGTLEHLLNQNGAMSPQEAAAIGLDLCRALSAVHRAGLVHRDVKAQNVMREANGRVVLMDFGTGELVTDNAGVASIVGTPLYLAPELLRNESLTPAADLYSLGVLLYHLVTGGYPVVGTSIEEIRSAHQLGRRQYLRDARPDLPARFVEVIERSLSSDSSGRFESAGMMELALAEALVGDVADRVPSPRAGEKPARPWTFASLWGWGALLAMLTAAVVLLVFAARYGKTPDQGAAATTAGSGPVIRKVSVPGQWTYIGRPAPNGRHLTYVDSGGDLAVVDPASGAPRQLTKKGDIDEASEMASAVSADGTRVAYTWRTLDNNFEMRLINIDGRWPRVLVRRNDVSVPHPLQWSRDGRRILSLLERSDRTNALALVDSTTGEITVIKDLGTARPQHASMSADGRFVAFDYPQAAGSAARDISLVRIDGGHEVPLVRHESSDMFPMWTVDGRLLFFSDRTAGLGAWLQTVADGKPVGEPRLVEKALGRIQPLGLTDSGTLFFLKPTGLVDVYVADLNLIQGPSKPRVIAPNYVGENLSSGFSRDGRFIAWMSMRSMGSTEPYSRVLSIRDLQTGEQRDLLPALAFFSDIQWAPDGRRILVRGMDLEQRTGRHIVDVRSGRVTAAIIGPSDVVGNAVWSADGTEILYGRRNTAIVARAIETGTERVVVDVSAEGFLGRGNAQTFGVSPDGRAIAFRVVRPISGEPGTPAVSILRVQRFAGAAKDLVSVEPTEGIEFQDWTPDGRSVLFTRFAQKERRKRTLWRIDADGGELRSMGLQMDALREVRVRRDGRLMTFTTGDSRWEVWATENFLSR